MFNAYAEIAIDLVVNIAAIFLLAYVLYFRRHRRADLLLAYVALNIGIFVAISLLTTVRVDIALGFGLFAILSIIRLRSTSVTQQEVAYYFVALVLGLVNGIGVPDRGLVVAMNIVLLLTMLAFDSKPLRDRSRRMDIRLDGVYTNEAALVAELERKLSGRVAYQEITEIDLIHGHMLIDVRLRPGQGVIEPPTPKTHLHEADGARPAGRTRPPKTGQSRRASAADTTTSLREVYDRWVEEHGGSRSGRSSQFSRWPCRPRWPDVPTTPGRHRRARQPTSPPPSW